MRGLRKTGREGEENSKAALGFAREDANHRRRGRSKPVAPTTAEDNVNGKGESQKRLLAACATRATSTAGPKSGRDLTPRPAPTIVTGKTTRPVFFDAFYY